jgi:Fe2+ or Zn2+ uptake regulation protein
MEATQIDTTERLLAEYLKAEGRHFSRAGRTVVRAFTNAGEPISILDLTIAVKRLDPLVSLSTVRGYLKFIRQAGLATAAKAVTTRGDRGPMLFEMVRNPIPAIGGFAPCAHRQVVCKDCGAAIAPDQVEDDAPDGEIMKARLLELREDNHAR